MAIDPKDPRILEKRTEILDWSVRELWMLFDRYVESSKCTSCQQQTYMQLETVMRKAAQIALELEE